MTMTSARLPHDWYDGSLPANLAIDPTAYLGTSYSFRRYRSVAECGLRLARGASLTDGAVLDVGPQGRISVGAYTLISGACLICDDEIEIGDYGLIAWNVVMMDSYRAASHHERRQAAMTKAIRIGHNVWIGFEACILPGVHIGDDAIVAARAVVAHDVPAGHLAAGNPARVTPLRGG